MIDMGELPPMDLIHELHVLSEKIKRKTNPDAFNEVSDLVSMLVAASVGESRQMLHEIVVRDQNAKLSKELDELLAKSSYDNEQKET